MISVQRVPQGLANVIGSFGGQTPQTLGDSIVGVLELTQFYAQQQLRSSQVTGAIAQGATLTIVVPPGQWWLLSNASTTASVSATTTAVKTSISLTPPGNTIPVQVAVGGVETIVAGNAYSATQAIYAPAQPQLLAPGTVIAVRLDKLTVDANTTVALNVLIGVLG